MKLSRVLTRLQDLLGSSFTKNKETRSISFPLETHKSFPEGSIEETNIILIYKTCVLFSSLINLKVRIYAFIIHFCFWFITFFYREIIFTFHFPYVIIWQFIELRMHHRDFKSLFQWMRSETRIVNATSPQRGILPHLNV